EEEEVSGRCAAILANGKRCPNAALPSSRYCGIPAHQALTDQDTDQIAPEPEPAVEAELEQRADDLGPDVEDSDGAAPDATEGARDLGPETDEPPTPSGAADSIDPAPEGSATSEAEEFESDPDGELEAQDVDPLPLREEE